MSHPPPKLTPYLETALRAVEPSGGRCEPVYHPCAAILKDGSRIECLYICEAQSWFRYWGVWPDEDRAKKDLNLLDISSIEESRFRLPARFANRLYEAGESGMGYTIFTIVFKDGSQRAYGTGNAVDFIGYPIGKSAADITEVLPHVGRDDPAGMMSCPDYVWRLYSL